MKHQLKQYTLRSGSRLLVIYGPGSDSAFFGISVGAGFHNAVAQKFEVPHLLEHLILRDESTSTDKAFSYLLEKNGIYFNAQTESYSTKFSFIAPKTSINEAIKLSIGRVTKLNLKVPELENEKNVIKDELWRTDETIKDKWNFQFTKVLSPWWLTPSQRLETLEKINLNDVIDFYELHYTANNTQYLLAGSFSDAEIKKVVALLEQLLASYQLGVKERGTYSHPSGYNQKIYIEEDEKAKKIYTTFAFIVPRKLSTIKPEIKLLYAILNDGLYCRLTRVLRQKGLSYGVDGGYSIDNDSSYLEFSFSAPKEKSLIIFKKVVRELQDVITGNFTLAELERAKGYTIGDLESGYSSIIDLVHWYGGEFSSGNKLIIYDDFIGKIRNASKTDLNRASKQLINRNNWTLMLAGKDVGEVQYKYRDVLKKYF